MVLTQPKIKCRMPRAVIHINIADFAVAVERVVDPRLVNRPVIIAPEDSARAAVYDMSEEAYRSGVRKQMALKRALRLCRDAHTLPPHPDRYERAMQALLKQALPYSPRIESGDGDGHLFVDVTGTSRLLGPPVDVARRLSRQVKTGLGLSPIWSVASNKLVAKVATRLVKPMGEYVVKEGEEQTTLAPLPIWFVPGIEQGDLLKLRELNLSTVAQVAALFPAHLEVLFGNRAAFLYESVRGVDNSPVLPVGKERPVVGIGHEFSEDTNDLPMLERVLYRMTEEAGRQLRRRRLAACRIGITLDYSDGLRRSRRSAAKPATADDPTLFRLAGQALSLAWTRRVRIRHMRLVCDGLVFPPAQLALFPESREKRQKRDRLMTVLDRIHDRFGPDMVRMGRTLAA
jgi:DNA polymerase-4